MFYTISCIDIYIKRKQNVSCPIFLGTDCLYMLLVLICKQCNFSNLMFVNIIIILFFRFLVFTPRYYLTYCGLFSRVEEFSPADWSTTWSYEGGVLITLSCRLLSYSFIISNILSHWTVHDRWCIPATGGSTSASALNCSRLLLIIALCNCILQTYIHSN